MKPTRQRLPALLASVLVSACAVGPDYQRPSAPEPAAYKEVPQAGATWLPAAPADLLDRGPWWRLFDDPELDALMVRIEVSNQNVAAAVASYRQARALVAQQRAALFPSLGLTGGASRSGGGRSSAQGSGGNSFQAGLDASWVPDVWGRLARTVESAQASAEASQADLAAARLSAQAELATDYFQLRDADAELDLLRRTVDGYQRALTITRNRYNAGIAAKTDVLQAQTQLASTQADLVSLQGQRAQLEHAIAMLVGKTPADFALAPGAWKRNVPAVPLGIPSALLERRPDIAAAERAVAAANAQIGIERAAYYPNLSLTASYGSAAERFGDLFKASSMLWSLGLSATQTLFDAGATRAAVQGAEAARDAAIARYRQAVIAAFQGVEDQLASTRSLAEQADFRREASEAADQTEVQLLNRYTQGLVAYTDVVTAQATALSARRTLSALIASRQATAVALIQALGGGWHVGLSEAAEAASAASQP
ncbi:MAG: efflux transporter outer membrane subunit [Proteobacteria bacterium]|nr:efflux transporter outer membrane subunit [Pseudomonadota bacterium]